MFAGKRQARLRQAARTLVVAMLSLLLWGCADLQLADLAYTEGDYQRAESHWVRLADKGFPEAHYRLAQMYAEGVLGEPRVEDALYHYRQAIAAGYSRSASGLGRFLIRHAGDLERANELAQALVEFADAGDDNAQLAVADLKLNGIVLEQDVPGALQILRSLAGVPDPRALFRLGAIYETGIQVPQDFGAAAGYYQDSLDLGYGKAGLYLADLYEYGKGVEKDVEHARSILSRLAETGDPSAAYALGGLLERQDPDGVPPEAVNLYRDSATLGYEPSRLRLARLYLEGQSLDQNVARAMQILQQLSLESYGPATTQLGDLYRDGDFVEQDFGRALNFYERALDQGHDEAEIRIAAMMRDGEGMPRDLAGSRAIYSKYALLGNVSAAYGLAKVIEMMNPDATVIPDEALRWYQRSAEAQHDGARLRMAELYVVGNGVEKDVERALELLQELDEQEEYISATRFLGDLYRDGDNVDRDHIKARDYYRRAIDLGDENSKMRLADLYAKGDPAVLDFDGAAGLYVELMDEGDISAIYKLARLHEQRLPDDTVTPEIVEWYRQAAEAHYPPAMIRLADLKLEGIGTSQDVDSALALYHEMASAGLGSATYRLAKLKEYGEAYREEYDESFALYRQAVEQGYDNAELHLGRLYGEGKAALGDLERAREILQRFADNDSARAAHELAELYVNRGEEIALDWQNKAANWYQRAADLGSTRSLYDLAKLLESESKEPTERSMALLREAASSGEAKAMLELGRRIFRGDYLTRNTVEGLAMVLVSARLQASNAIETAMDFMADMEDPSQIDQARRRADAIYKDQFGAAQARRQRDQEEDEDG